jgi:hypothetical protein
MPLQRVVERDALADEPLTVVDEQPQIELRPVQVRDREGLQALLQRRSVNGKRVDRVRLAALASALSGPRGQVGRDPQHPLAAGDQKPLQAARDVPAVLKRPDALIVALAGPRHQRPEPRAANLNRALAHQLARRRADAGDRVRALVRVRTEHDH